MLTEADTGRKYVVPIHRARASRWRELQGAGWDSHLHSIAEQRFFTKGRVVRLTDYPAEKVCALCAGPEEQTVPVPKGGRAQDPGRGIDFACVASQACEPDANPLDPLYYLCASSAALRSAARLGPNLGVALLFQHHPSATAETGGKAPPLMLL